MSGLAAVWIRGDNLFELFAVPAFDPGNKELRRNAVQLHEWLANGLLAAAALHLFAALWHHWKLKDGLLNRMWPNRL
jgi:cytochrome b561